MTADGGYFSRHREVLLMPKFFISPADIRDGNISLTGEDVRHIRKVLRHRVGDRLTLSDGCGTDYAADITAISPEEVRLKIVRSGKSDSEMSVSVTLFQCIPKSGKMDFIAQKCTELGVARIVPVESMYVVGKPDSPQKIARCQKIAAEAAKQCGRGVIPTVEAPISFADAVARFPAFDTVIMPYESAKEGSVKKALSAPGRSIAILIGPEGGFSAEEVALARAHGAAIVTLGKRILRTETAGCAVLAMILYELEL